MKNKNKEKKVKLPKNFGKMKETECYYPICKHKGTKLIGNKYGKFLLCKQHAMLVHFIIDIISFEREI